MMDRRNFIKASALSTGGLFLSVSMTPPVKFAAQARNLLHPINLYLSISSDESVVITNPVPEIGQGVSVALPMLVAEELGIEWGKVSVRQADAGQAYGGNDQRAAGSNSVRIYWEPMRKAGAAARALLISVASERWGIGREHCYVDKGFIYNKVDKRSISFGAVAAQAATMPIPEPVELKKAADFKLIGKSVRNPDIRSILNGSITFGLDVRIPGMRYASIEKCSTYGGTVKSFEASRALSVSGVESVFRIPYHGNAERPFCREGIAVVGTSAWAVIQGRKALEIEWDLGPNTNESTQDLHLDCQKLIEAADGTVVKNVGNVYDAIESSGDRILEADYHLPFIGHIPMETVNCTIDLKEDRCEIWSTTQMPFADLNFLARFLDIPVEKISLHLPRIGGGFGRRLGPDFTIEAAKVAKEIQQPVQLFWTREDDIRFDAYRPFSYHKLRASYSEQGEITAWLHRQAGTSRHAFRPDSQPHRSEFFSNHFPANLIANFRQEYALAVSNISRSLIRAPGNNALAFAVESFMDEMAYATKSDPLAFRLRLLGEGNRDFVFDESEGTVISTGRMRKVLEMAAAKAGWGKQLPPGRGMGIASYFTFDSYVAHVAEVSVEAGQLTIHRFVSAIDCGQVVNVDGIKAQTEGAIMDGSSATLFQEITLSAGETDQSNFNDYKVLRISDAPRSIEVHIVKNEHPPTGMGEPPYPPVAPALCNALFAACGIRIRTLPIGNQLKEN